MKCPICNKEEKKDEMYICDQCGRAVCVACIEFRGDGHNDVFEECIECLKEVK